MEDANKKKNKSNYIWGKYTKEKVQEFKEKQNMPYDVKLQYAGLRAKEFVQECERRGLNTHVSVGGIDSITLLCFLRSIGIDSPGVSVSHLEDISIQKVHKELGVERIPAYPRKSGGGLE